MEKGLDHNPTARMCMHAALCTLYVMDMYGRASCSFRSPRSTNAATFFRFVILPCISCHSFSVHFRRNCQSKIPLDARTDDIPSLPAFSSPPTLKQLALLLTYLPHQDQRSVSEGHRHPTRGLRASRRAWSKLPCPGPWDLAMEEAANYGTGTYVLRVSSGVWTLGGVEVTKNGRLNVIRKPRA